VESISKASAARQTAIQRPYNTQAIRTRFNRDQRYHITGSYRAIDLAKAFCTDCLIHLIEQYGLFMLYLSHKLKYSELKMYQIFASMPNSGPNSVFVFGRIASSE